MPRFDITTEKSAIEAPEIILDGVTYIGKVLSIEEFLPFEARRKASDLNDIHAILEYARSYFYAIFPKPPRYAFWQKDIVPTIIAQPNLVEILTSFLGCQTQAMFPQSLMNGTNLPSAPLAVTDESQK